MEDGVSRASRAGGNATPLPARFGTHAGTPSTKEYENTRGAIAAPTVLKRGTRAKAQQTFQRWKLPGGINFEILTLISFD